MLAFAPIPVLVSTVVPTANVTDCLPACSFAKSDIRSATLLEELPIKIHNSDIIKVWLQDAVAKQGAVAATSFDRLDLATNAYLVRYTASLSSSRTLASDV